jgi:hypothetical protein
LPPTSADEVELVSERPTASELAASAPPPTVAESNQPVTDFLSHRLKEMLAPLMDPPARVDA